MSSRTTRAAWTFGSGILTQALMLGCGFVATPIVLRELNDQRYGASRALTDWFSHLSLLELGLGGALLSMLAKAAAQEERSNLAGLLGLAMRIYAAVAMAMVLAGGVLYFCLPKLVPVPLNLQSDVRSACLIGIASLAMAVTLPFRALTEARQRGFVINALLGGQAVLSIGLSVAFAEKQWGVTGQLAALAIGQLPLPIFLTTSTLRAHPQALRIALRGPVDRGAFRQLTRLNWQMLWLNGCTRASIMSDTVIVTFLLGPLAVVPLVLTQRLANAAQGPIQMIGTSSWAALAELHARGERARFGERLIELSGMTSLLAAALLAPIFAFDPAFVERWVGATHFGGDLLNGTACFNVFAQSQLALWAWAFIGTGNARPLLWTYAVSTAINVGVSLSLAKLLGPVGPVIGTAVATLSVLGWRIPQLLQREYGLSLVRLVRTVFPMLAVGAVYAIGLRWLAMRAPLHTYVALGLAAASASLTFLLIAPVLLWPPESRDRLWVVVRFLMLKRGSGRLSA